MYAKILYAQCALIHPRECHPFAVLVLQMKILLHVKNVSVEIVSWVDVLIEIVLVWTPFLPIFDIVVKHVNVNKNKNTLLLIAIIAAVMILHSIGKENQEKYKQMTKGHPKESIPSRS